jgi:hypothetical protein
MLKYLLFPFVLYFLNACSNKPDFRTGDLIFQDLDCELCEAIEGATRAFGGKPVSHMGVIMVSDSGTYVLEAYDKVQIVPLDSFLKRSPKIMLGRLKKPWRKYISAAMERGREKKGLPYDDEFKLNNGKYYCSELIYDIFLDENGQPLFDVYPMNFKNLKTGVFDSVWINYFHKMKRPVPQGEPGCNPAGYSRSDKLEIIYATY